MGRPHEDKAEEPQIAVCAERHVPQGGRCLVRALWPVVLHLVCITVPPCRTHARVKWLLMP
jgi:hypothetical protein